jgi:lipopolysaccharide/colanic/teichoic acid biosynthesis glycosyltransferase
MEATWRRVPESHSRTLTIEPASAGRVAAEPPWQPVAASLAAAANPAARESRVRRAIECLVAIAALALTLPLLLVIAAIVKLDSPGPAVFRQWRVGRDGRLFRFAKFRTLYVDAAARWPELYAYRYGPDELAALHFKTKNDPRVTRVGRWLRTSTLDELPNFWNVLTGDVALVGPRPEIPEMLPYYDREGLQKFSVRPGVTGLAQVKGRGDLSFRDTIAFDVEYVRRRSAGLDVRILLQTVVSMLLRKGAF